MQKEPAAIIGLITAALSLLVLYGILNVEQAGAWGALAAAAIPVIQGLVTRHFVWSPKSVEQATRQAETNGRADATRHFISQ